MLAESETHVAKAERHQMAVFFYETESLMALLGMLAAGSTLTRGRKPRSEGHVDVVGQRKCHGWAGGRPFDAGQPRNQRGC